MDEVIRLSLEKIIFDNPRTFHYNDCHDPVNWSTVTTVLSNFCWELVPPDPQEPGGLPQARICPNDAGWCVTHMTVCQDGPFVRLLQRGYVIYVPGSCSAPPASGEWEEGVCYEVSLCDYDVAIKKP